MEWKKRSRLSVLVPKEQVKHWYFEKIFCDLTQSHSTSTVHYNWKLERHGNEQLLWVTRKSTWRPPSLHILQISHDFLTRYYLILQALKKKKVYQPTKLKGAKCQWLIQNQQPTRPTGLYCIIFQQENGPSPFNGAHKGEWSGWHGDYEVRFKLIYSYWTSLLGGFESIS